MKRNMLILTVMLVLSSISMANYLTDISAVAAGAYPRGITAADVNGDGIKEVAVANFGTETLIGQDTAKEPDSSISIFTKSGNGSFSEQKIKAGKSPRGLDAADFNNDGKDELIVSNYDDGTVMILLGESTVTLQAGRHPVGVASGDLDNDGKKDIAVAVYSDNKVVVFLNDGMWTKKEITLIGSPTDVAIGKIGRGSAIVSANYTTGDLSVIRLDASGLVKTQDLKAGGGPCKVEVADVTGDGEADIVASNFYDSTITVIGVDAGGNFKDAVAYPVGGRMPNGMAVADVTGDKLNDVITANRDDDTISVLVQKDGILLAPYTIQVTKDDVKTYGPVEVIGADINADGLNDVAFTHMRSNTLRVMYQQFPKAPAITSATHPDQSAWYTEDKAALSLSTVDLSGVAGYYWLVTTDEKYFDIKKAAFTETADVKISLSDAGVNYFKAVTKDINGNISAVPAVYKINITEEMSEKNTYNYPNPCSGPTTIRFALAKQKEVKILITDIKDIPVWHRDLSAAEVIAGVNSITWNLLNDAGKRVNNGVYIFKVITAEKTVSKKIVVIK